MREESKGRYEMLWDCPACGTARLLGVTHRHCPTCGAAQDPARRYFPPESERVAVEDHPFQGADRICPACDTPNAAKAEFCVGCGSPLDGAKAAARRGEQRSGAKDSADAASKEAAARKKAEEARRIAEMSGGDGGAAKAGIGLFGVLALLGIGGCGCAGVVVALLMCFGGGETTLTVKKQQWQRVVPIEKLVTRKDSAWRDQVPSKAVLGDCDQKVRDRKKVEDGEDCVDKQVDKGDGSFEEKRVCTTRYREEPVYGEMCDYTIDVWQVSESVESKGEGLQPAPSWPEPKLTKPGDCVGCERIGARFEDYLVVLEDGGTFHECHVPAERWSKMTVGSTWTGPVNFLGDLDCDGLQPR